MAGTQSLTVLRDAIQGIYHEMMKERVDGEISNEVVLDKAKALLANEIEAVTPELVRMALIKILNDLGNRKRGRTVPSDQFDLFEGYRVPDFISIGRQKKKAVGTLTIVQANQYLEAHSRRAAVDRHAPLRRLIEDCAPFSQSDDDTLDTLMERRREAGARKSS